jgi:hypothetical protein
MFVINRSIANDETLQVDEFFLSREIHFYFKVMLVDGPRAVRRIYSSITDAIDEQRILPSLRPV